ncbi:MAG: hypothetical protein C6I01_05900 [Epsilonproteobacteria bacterium]|nr:hypothetical protein [Campylobacterota bacterium]NPA89047.1 hypothetical protein [Campylobacterota bacterium]
MEKIFPKVTILSILVGGFLTGCVSSTSSPSTKPKGISSSPSSTSDFEVPQQIQPDRTINPATPPSYKIRTWNKKSEEIPLRQNPTQPTATGE